MTGKVNDLVTRIELIGLKDISSTHLFIYRKKFAAKYKGEHMCEV